MNSLKSVLFVFQMPETEDNIEIETQSMNTETLHDNSIVPMEIQDSQPSESNGQAANQEVIDLENDTGKEKERKQMAPRSNVWNHFNKIKDDKGFLKSAQCKYCSRPMKAESKGHGTSSLSRHLQSCPRNPNKFENDRKQGTLQGEGVTTWRFDQDALRAAFAEMVVEDEEPFSMGERSDFRKFMSKGCPRFQLPSRRTCTRDTVRLYFQERAN